MAVILIKHMLTLWTMQFQMDSTVRRMDGLEVVDSMLLKVLI